MPGDPYSLDTIAMELLDAVALCLDMHTPEGAPEMRFPSIGDPVNPGCDYLSVWYTSWSPMMPFPVDMNEARVCERPEWGSLINVKLRWCGYPHLTREGNTGVLPDPTQIRIWHQRITVAARALQCCLPSLYAEGALFTDPNFPGAPPELVLPVIWRTMTPYREAAWVGIDWPILVDLSLCCPLPVLEPDPDDD